MGSLQKNLAGVSEGKRPLGKPSSGWAYVKAVVKAGGCGVRAGFVWFSVVSKVGIL